MIDGGPLGSEPFGGVCNNSFFCPPLWPLPFSHPLILFLSVAVSVAAQPAMAYMFRLPSNATRESVESAPPPPIPQKSPNRSRPPAFGPAILQGDPVAPPPYTAVIYAEGAKSDRKSSYIQDGMCMRFVGRGISRRACAVVVVMLVLVIALAVGLAIGIRKRHQANVKYVFVHIVAFYLARGLLMPDFR
jgi:hypothetical protein